jgi:hypothetical protein
MNENREKRIRMSLSLIFNLNRGEFEFVLKKYCDLNIFIYLLNDRFDGDGLELIFF